MSSHLAATSSVPELANQLRVLADPTRLRIFDLLMGGVRCNCELGDALDLAPNLISHHLGVLRRAGLVSAERDPFDARWVYYAVDRPALSALFGQLTAFFDPGRIQEREPQCGPRALPACDGS